MADKLIISKTGTTTKAFTQEEIEQREIERLASLPTLDEIKEERIQSLSAQCNEFILNGFDFEIDGEIKHFSMDIYDQVKIDKLYDLIKGGASMVSWHSDSGKCIFFDAETFTNFYIVGVLLVGYMTTKFNTGLREYINNEVLTEEEIDEIDILFTLPTEYQDEVLEKTTVGVGMTVEQISPIIEAYGW